MCVWRLAGGEHETHTETRELESEGARPLLPLSSTYTGNGAGARARATLHTLTPPVHHTHRGHTKQPNTHAVREPHMWLRDTFFNACVCYFTIFTSHPPGRGARGRAAPRAGGARAGRPPQYSVVPHIRRCLDARAPWPAKRTTVHADGVCLQRVVFLIPFVPRLARACHTSKRLGGSPRGAGRGDARG